METPFLQIRLLGGVDLRSGQTPLALESARAESLLAHLILHRAAPQSRQRPPPPKPTAFGVQIPAISFASNGIFGS